MSTKFDISSLNAEFASILTHFTPHHENMRSNVDYYQHSAFFAPKRGDVKVKNKIGINLLKAFADKNINYTSIFPSMKVPSPDTTPEGLSLAQQNEKIIYSAHEENNTRLKQKTWSADATLMSEAFAETTFDLKKRRVKITRLDPRFCYYRFANQNDNKISVFWYAFPMSLEQIKAEYNITLKGNSLNVGGYAPDGNLISPDSTEKAWVIKRLDDETECMWAGDQFIITPHKHTNPFGIPIDRCVPLNDFDSTRFPQFFLDPIIPLQAEFNDTFAQKQNILRRLSKIPVVVKGVAANQADKVKEALLTGGFIGLKTGGEAMFLQLNETKLHDTHMADLFQRMKDITGYTTVTFGEIAGANTSGDAVSMYYQPTTQMAQNQWLSWSNFYEAINEKILRLYEFFGKINEDFEMYGSLPHGTFEQVEVETTDGEIKKVTKYNPKTSFRITFKGADINKYYRSQVIAPSVTPKDEVSYKRLLMEASTSGFLAKMIAYEEWGATDAKEWLDLLEEEQSNPALNPEGMSKIMSAANSGGNVPPQGIDNAPMGVNPNELAQTTSPIGA